MNLLLSRTSSSAFDLSDSRASSVGRVWRSRYSWAIRVMSQLKTLRDKSWGLCHKRAPPNTWEVGDRVFLLKKCQLTLFWKASCRHAFCCVGFARRRTDPVESQHSSASSRASKCGENIVGKMTTHRLPKCSASGPNYVLTIRSHQLKTFLHTDITHRHSLTHARTRYNAHSIATITLCSDRQKW